MSGSLAWRAYTCDNGQVYSINVDESNANAVVTGGVGGALLPQRTVSLPLLPTGCDKRYVLTRDSVNQNEKRKFYVGTAASAAALSVPGATITAEDYPGAGDAAGVSRTWVVTAYRGEKMRMAPPFSSPDTGLTDGSP